MAKYLVVPFRGTLKSGVLGTEDIAAVSTQLQSAIENQTRLGWEFYSMEKVDIEVKPGCLGILLGGKASYLAFDQIVFTRPD